MGEIQLKINLTYKDDFMSSHITRDTMLWQFICWGIFLPVVSLLGLVGNALTIVVLWRKEMQSTTILYLRALVVTDTGILLSSAVVLTPFACANYLHNEELKYFSENVYPQIYTPINYIVMTLQSCNVWITVAVSVERYIAICQPFRAARLCTRRKTLIVIGMITLLSVLYNIPRLFATYAKKCQETDEQAEESCYNLVDTKLGMWYWYRTVYVNIMYTLLVFVVPLAALFILNVFLIQELMRMQRRRSGTNIQEENEANLSLVLVLIVVVFILCQAGGLLSQFDIFDLNTFLRFLAVSNLLFVINSAVNFLIYTAFGSKFRKVLLRVFRKLVNHSRSLSLRGSVVTNGYELTNVHDSTAMDTLQHQLHRQTHPSSSPSPQTTRTPTTTTTTTTTTSTHAPTVTTTAISAGGEAGDATQPTPPGGKKQQAATAAPPSHQPYNSKERQPLDPSDPSHPHNHQHHYHHNNNNNNNNSHQDLPPDYMTVTGASSESDSSSVRSCVGGGGGGGSAGGVTVDVVVQTERTPLTKGLQSNGGGGRSLDSKSADRYPPLSNCASANGPEPADV